MTELKPCPWCQLRPHFQSFANGKSWDGGCDNRDCPVRPQMPLKDTQAEAIAVWNNQHMEAEGRDRLADAAMEGARIGDE